MIVIDRMCCTVLIKRSYKLSYGFNQIEYGVEIANNATEREILLIRNFRKSVSSDALRRK